MPSPAVFCTGHKEYAQKINIWIGGLASCVYQRGHWTPCQGNILILQPQYWYILVQVKFPFIRLTFPIRSQGRCYQIKLEAPAGRNFLLIFPQLRRGRLGCTFAHTPFSQGASWAFGQMSQCLQGFLSTHEGSVYCRRVSLLAFLLS